MGRHLLTFFFLITVQVSFSQLLSWSPDFPTEQTTGFTINMNATQGNQGLLGHSPFDVYVHIGVITNKSANASDWKHVTSVWGNTDPAFRANPASGSNRWTYTISSSLKSFFNITDPTEKIEKIAILFRSGNGSKKQANTDGSDMYIPVYTTDVAVRITDPAFQPKYQRQPEPITKSVGDAIAVTAKANKSSSMRILLNGVEVQSAAAATTISASPTLIDAGNQMIVAEANDGATTVRDTLSFFISGGVNVAPLPAGARQGINYINATTATLVLYAPGKGRVSVIGDLPGSNWTEQAGYQMNKTPDNNYWWITLSGLEPGKEYSFQYLVNGSVRIADPYAEKILDPYNDQYISNATYPGLKPYPAGLTTEVVGILQTDKPQYAWSGKPYTRPDKRNLIIYELLLRDFVDKHDWNTLRDSLNYLKRLGVNAIELLPFNEFEGNNSWGYNPDFYFAPDKYYGPANTLKEFIDSCHANGIAVIMDIALNHSFGMSPMVRLYWDAVNNRPAGDNPWFNRAARHAFNVGYDMNHESAATKYFVSRVLQYWMSEYRIDGFRFDLSKGFTQKQTCDNNGGNCDVGAWSAYDQSRIDIWKAYHDTMQKYSPGSYTILEHFADNSEEKVLSDYGMMLWGNANHSYNQATMGWSTDWNFEWALANKRSWSSPYLISYMESHDEERLMYKNMQFGNATATYNIKVLDTALQRQALATAFFLTLPGPKMIWQFGELGYDFPINYCPNGTINENCRTDPKPIRWDYYQDERRKKLFDVYMNLIHLRKQPEFFNAFTSNNPELDFSGAFKWLRLNTPTAKLVVIGNFDVVNQTGSVTFPSSGIWYDYLNGTTFTATGGSQAFTLKPGEFRVFTNTFVALSVDLERFTATHQGTHNLLTWRVTKEDELSDFEVQRSNDGVSFSTVGDILASGERSYRYADHNIASSGRWYYRLKMNNRDGGFTYSDVVLVRGTTAGLSVTATPNPFSGSVRLNIQSAVSQTADAVLTGIDGRQLGKRRIQLQAGSNEVGFAETNSLADGVYFIRIITDQSTTTTRIVKKR